MKKNISQDQGEQQIWI